MAAQRASALAETAFSGPVPELDVVPVPLLSPPTPAHPAKLNTDNTSNAAKILRFECIENAGKTSGQEPHLALL